MTISATDVKALRDRTGVGMMDCKNALAESDGDVEKAIEVLRVKGQASAAKREGRQASEGTVSSYIHANGNIGVLLEVNCETDFVSQNEDFQEFAREVALHIAAANPLFVSEEDVDEESIEGESKIFEQQAADKPEEIRQKIVEGRVRKWMEGVVLLNQQHVNQEKHEERTIDQMREEISSKTGEKIVIKRFARFEMGGE